MPSAVSPTVKEEKPKMPQWRVEYERGLHEFGCFPRMPVRLIVSLFHVSGANDVSPVQKAFQMIDDDDDDKDEDEEEKGRCRNEGRW